MALLHIQANLVSIAESIPGSSGTRNALAEAKGISESGSDLPLGPLPLQLHELCLLPSPMPCCSSVKKGGQTSPLNVDIQAPNAHKSKDACSLHLAKYGKISVSCVHPDGISTAAEEALQQGCNLQPPDSPQSSPPAQGTDPVSGGGSSWKGQQGLIGDLIHLWLAWSPQPCQTIQGLLQGALAQVPCQPLAGKKAQEPVAPYPGAITQCH